MKRTVFTFLVLLLCQYLCAGTVDRRAALKKAAACLGSDAQPELVLAGEGEHPAYYLYNNKVGKGFVIIAGEDSFSHVIGYSKEGHYDPSNVPPAFRHWLRMMERQVMAVRSGWSPQQSSAPQGTAVAQQDDLSASHRAATPMDPIAPLLTTHWSQDAPFNMLVPEYEEGVRSLTGCVATAMAQILKYYSHDAPVTAIPAYKTEKLGKQMPELPATTFNYALMRDDYSTADVSESAREVARLMQYCGQAVAMNYGESSGAGAPITAFSNFFGYNPYAYSALRSQYPAYAWTQLIYRQLSQAHPVMFTGLTFSRVGFEGHAFICDGYDGEGLFHFNWGWRGDLDGWYALAECNPYATGEGDGNGWDGFSIDQMAMINLFPNEEPTDVRLTVDALECKKDTLTRDGIGEDFLVPVDVTVFNQTAGQRTYDIGLALYADGDQRDTTWKVASGVAIQPNYGVMFSKLLAIGEGVDEGQFILRFVCRQAGTEPWLWGYNGDIYLMLNVKGDTLTVEKPVTRLAVKGIRFEGSRQPGTLATMQVKLSNEGRRMYDELYLFVNNRHTTGVGLFVDAGETREVPLHFLVPEDPVVLKLYTGIVKTGDNSYRPGGLLLWDGTISDTSREPNLWVNNIVIDRRTYYQEKTAIVGTAFSQTATLTNNDSEPFDGDVLAYLYKNSDEGDWFNFERYQVQHVTIAPGAAADIPFSFTGLTVGLRYLTNLHVNSPTGMKLLIPSQTYAYRILGNIPHTAVEALEANPAGKPLYYDMQGRPIGQPRTKGLYITKGRKLLAK